MSWDDEHRSRDYTDSHRRTHRSHREDGRQSRSDYDEDSRRSQHQRDYDDVNDHRYRSDYDSDRRNRNGSSRRFPTTDYTNSSRQQHRRSNDLNDNRPRNREQSSRPGSMLNHASQQNSNRSSSSSYTSEWYRGESDFTQQSMLGGYSIPSPPQEVSEEPLNNTEDAEEEALRLLEEVKKLETGEISDLKTEIPEADPEQYEIYWDDFLSYPENGPVPEWYQTQLDIKVEIAKSRLEMLRNRVCWSDDRVKEQIELMERDHSSIFCKMDEPRHPKVDQAWFNTWKFDCRPAVKCGSYVPGHVHTQACEKNSFVPTIVPTQQSLPYEIPKYISEIVEEITEFTNTVIENNITVNFNKPEWKWIRLRSNYKCEVLVIIGVQYISSIVYNLKKFYEDKLFKTTKICSLSYIDIKPSVKNKSNLPTINLCGEFTMLDKVGNVCVQYDHKTNMQFNAVEFNILGKVIHEYLDPEIHTTIIDIGSTVGLLGCMMGNKNCAKVIGLIDSKHGMETAESIKSLNEIHKATFMECDRDKVHSKSLSLTTSCSSVVILNMNSVYGRYSSIYNDIRNLPTVWRLVIYGSFKPDYVKYFTKLTNTNEEVGEPFLPMRYCVLDKSPSNRDEFIIVLLLERPSLVDGKTKAYKEGPTMNVGSEHFTSQVANNNRNEAAPTNDNMNIFRIPTREPDIPLFTTVTHGEVFSVHCSNQNLIGTHFPVSEWKLHRISLVNPYFKTYREIPESFINMEIDARYQRHLELRNQSNVHNNDQQTMGNSYSNSENRSRNIVAPFISLVSRVENPYSNNFRNIQQNDITLPQNFNSNNYPGSTSETFGRHEDCRVENPFNRQANSRDPRNKSRSTESRNLTFENRSTNTLNDPRSIVSNTSQEKVKLGLKEYKKRLQSSDSSVLTNLNEHSNEKELQSNQSGTSNRKEENVCKIKSSNSQFTSSKKVDEVHKVRSTINKLSETHKKKMDEMDKQKSLISRSTSQKQKEPDVVQEKKSTKSNSIEIHQKKTSDKSKEMSSTIEPQISNEKSNKVSEKKSTSGSQKSYEKSDKTHEKSNKVCEKKSTSGSQKSYEKSDKTHEKSNKVCEKKSTSGSQKSYEKSDKTHEKSNKVCEKKSTSGSQKSYEKSNKTHEKSNKVCEKKSTSRSQKSYEKSNKTHEKLSTSTLQTQNEKSKKAYTETPSSCTSHSSCSVEINKSPADNEKEVNHKSLKERKHHTDKSHKHHKDHKHKSHKKKSHRSSSSSHKDSTVQKNLNSIPMHIEPSKYIETEPESINNDNDENMSICSGSQLPNVNVENMDQRKNPCQNSNQEFLSSPVAIKTEPGTAISDQKYEGSDSDLEILPPVKEEPVYVADSDEDILVPKPDEGSKHDFSDESIDEQPPFVPLPDKPTRNTNQLQFLSEVVQKLWNHKYGWAFQVPLLSHKIFNLNNYSNIISKHMDLGTIKKRLENKFYWSSNECLNDFEIMFKNVFSCMKEEDQNVVHMMAKKMKNSFDELIIEMPSVEFDIDEEDLSSMATPERVPPALSQEENSTCSFDGVKLSTKGSYINVENSSNRISSFKFQEQLQLLKNESITASKPNFKAQVPTQVGHTSANQVQQQPELTQTPIVTVKQEPYSSNTDIQSQLDAASVNQIELQTESAQTPIVTVKQEPYSFDTDIQSQLAAASVNQFEQQPELTQTPIVTVKQEPYSSDTDIQSQLDAASVNQIELETESAQTPIVTVKQEPYSFDTDIQSQLAATLVNQVEQQPELTHTSIVTVKQDPYSSDADIQSQLDAASVNQIEQQSELTQTPMVTVKKELSSLNMEFQSKLGSKIEQSPKVVTEGNEQNLISLPLSLRIASNLTTVKVENEPNEESNLNLVNSDLTNIPITTHFTKTEYFLTEVSQNLNVIDSVNLKVENELLSSNMSVDSKPFKIMNQSENLLSKTSLKSEIENLQSLPMKNEAEMNTLKDSIKPELFNDPNLNKSRKRSSKGENEDSFTEDPFYYSSKDSPAQQMKNNSAKRPRLSCSDSESSPEAIRSLLNPTYHLNLTGLNDSNDYLRELPSTSLESLNSNELEPLSSDFINETTTFLNSVPTLH